MIKEFYMPHVNTIIANNIEIPIQKTTVCAPIVAITEDNQEWVLDLNIFLEIIDISPSEIEELMDEDATIPRINVLAKNKDAFENAYNKLSESDCAKLIDSLNLLFEGTYYHIVQKENFLIVLEEMGDNFEITYNEVDEYI